MYEDYQIRVTCSDPGCWAGPVGEKGFWWPKHLLGPCFAHERDPNNGRVMNKCMGMLVPVAAEEPAT